jgi:RNA polymerase sigma-70 factor (ECF subfamily)
MGPYRLQALIVSVHVSASTAGDTDWRSIVFLYRMLERLTPGPIVALNRAIAVAEADGPAVGLAELEAIDGLGSYHLWHAARGELLLRLGHAERARAAFQAALSLARNPTERRHLARRVAEASERRDTL